MVAICVPPLRTHAADIPALAQHFVDLYARDNNKHVTGLTERAMQASRYIQHVLERSRANISHAARLLGVDRRSLYRMMSRYSIVPPPRGD